MKPVQRENNFEDKIGVLTRASAVKCHLGALRVAEDDFPVIIIFMNSRCTWLAQLDKLHLGAHCECFLEASKSRGDPIGQRKFVLKLSVLSITK